MANKTDKADKASTTPSSPAGSPARRTDDGFILVRLTQKFRDRIFHEFHPDHPHETSNGQELLVIGDRVVEAARTPGVLSAIMQGVLEEVRDPDAVASPEPVQVVDLIDAPRRPAPASAPASAEETPR